MRIRALAYSVAGCAAALAVTWEIGQAVAPPPPPESAAVAAPAETSAPARPAPASPSTTPRSGASGASGTPVPAATKRGPTGTFRGSTSQTDYGPVQVAIVVRAGRITDVKALQLTNQDDRSVAISAGAAPVLRTEALQAQSAKIDTVSGATYTSDGYRRSLQSAIDAAGL